MQLHVQLAVQQLLRERRQRRARRQGAEEDEERGGGEVRREGAVGRDVDEAERLLDEAGSRDVLQRLTGDVPAPSARIYAAAPGQCGNRYYLQRRDMVTKDQWYSVVR